MTRDELAKTMYESGAGAMPWCNVSPATKALWREKASEVAKALGVPLDFEVDARYKAAKSVLMEKPNPTAYLDPSTMDTVAKAIVAALDAHERGKG